MVCVTMVTTIMATKKTAASKPRTARSVRKTTAAPAADPTPTQVDVLRGTHELAKKLGRTPTTYEIADALGYADHTGVIKPLRALVKLGLVVHTTRVVLSEFKVTPAGRKWLV
jgi:hypothetical protein